MDNPTQVQHYIRLACKKPLEKAMIQRWFKTVKNSTPENVVGSVQVEHPDKYLANVQLIHRTLADKHVYEIPLTRSLLQKEVDYIENQWGSKGMDWIEASAPKIDPVRKEVQRDVDDPSYKQMCEEVSKTLHNRWVSDKVSQGWRYGIVYSSKDKTHPLMKPWEDLPKKNQEVDYELPLELLKIFKKYYK